MIGDECLSWVLFNKARPKGKNQDYFILLILYFGYELHSWAASICNGKTVYGVSDTAEKLANMNIGRVTARQSFPAPMKAGGWHPGQPNLPASQEFHARRTFTRKVAG